MFARASRTAGSAAAALVLAVTAAWAQPVPEAQREARTRFMRGVAMFERGDHRAALAEFLAAYELVPRPSILFNLAATYEAMQRLPEAADSYRRFLALDGSSRRERADAERSLARIRSRLGVLRVTLAPPGAALALDGLVTREFGELLVTPGEHSLVARWPDGRERTERVVVTASQTHSLQLDAPPPAPAAATPAPSPMPPLGRLALRGIPAGAALHVDGALHPLSALLALPLGAHTLRVEADGRLPWEGPVRLTPRELTLSLRLATPRRGPAPALFWIAAGSSAALLLGAAITGALAVDTHADFSSRTRDDPALLSISNRGRTLAYATDGLLVSALVTSITALILGTQTTFSTPRSSATLDESGSP